MTPSKLEELLDTYRMGKNTVSGIVKETANTIWESLVAQGFLQAPSTEKEWIKIADDFEKRWNFGNCVGAISGKHKTHSIVLLAVVNSNYEYILVDIGDAGRQSDGGVFASSHLGHAMEENLLNIPKSRPLRITSKKFPFVFVGDEAFPLKEYLLKPYAKGFIQKKEQIANYRLSRARRQEENVFGICA
ncbi:uncharacterized protein LOC130646008 [Hydractinia symbiolongicarpus]|uniref:uncharacterized protein LOC130646008 n=1 Tax=Hydractinia symbiolongicarpus TaxID=13093 RepID=UPI00254E7F71|nr:uncharacterized protein LOC130646008 [Hydractinia symbiolongicarpus]